MNPRKFGGLANDRQEPWKMPLPQFIEACYRERFGKSAPDDVRPIEEKLRTRTARKEARRRAKFGPPRV